METILKSLREKHSYTVDELSRFFNNDKNLIKAWELGVAEPTISQCLILSKLYGISVDEMFSDLDISDVMPTNKVDELEYEAKFNRLAKRWYN